MAHQDDDYLTPLPEPSIPGLTPYQVELEGQVKGWSPVQYVAYPPR